MPRSPIQFEEYSLDCERYQLLRAGRPIKLEKIPMELLILLVDKDGRLVTRQEIVEQLWGKDVFVDTEHGINTAIRKIRMALRDDPEKPRFVQTVTGKGYRFIPDTRDGTNGARQNLDRALPTEATKIELIPPQPVPQPLRVVPRVWLMAVLITMALVLVGAGLLAFNAGGWRDRLLRHNVLTPIHSIAVLPLANLSGDSSQEYYADGMTDELTTRLSSIKALRVISRTSATRYKRSQKTLSDIAHELNVDAFVTGSVMRSGDRVRISAQLIRAIDGSNLWADTYERHLRDVLVLQADVARTIADQIKIQLTPAEREMILSATTVDSEAHDSYLMGIYYWNKFTEPGMRQAKSYFEKAVARDPNYAPAYAGLAHAYHELAYNTAPNEVMPKAKAAALRALQLDDSNAEAHAALGWLKLHYDWDWAGAETEFRRALEANPNSPLAHGQYAIYLDAMGRVAEGIKEHQAALSLDPVRLIDITSLGDAYHYARRYNEAIEQYQKALELDSTFAVAHAALAASYVELGAFQKAIAHIERAGQLDPDPASAADLAFVYAKSRHKREAAKSLTRLLTASSKSYISSAAVALVYSAIGNQSESCRWLQRAYEAHDVTLAYIRVTPEWDGMRSNPCFQGLVQRMGFPQAVTISADKNWIISSPVDMYAYKGMQKEAENEWETSARLRGDIPSALAVHRAFARAGLKGIFEWQLAEFKKQSAVRYTSPLDFAEAYAQLKRRNEAPHYLEQVLEERSPSLLHIQNDVDLDFLHSDPGYQTIVTRVGLHLAWATTP